MRRYSHAQEHGRVAILRHPVFLVKIFAQHARKGQPKCVPTRDCQSRPASSPALPTNGVAVHTDFVGSPLGTTRRRHRGAGAVKSGKRFNGVLARAGRTQELMGKKSDPHCKAININEEWGFFTYFGGFPLVVTFFRRSRTTITTLRLERLLKHTIIEIYVLLVAIKSPGLETPTQSD